jgi:formylglycine-generating enzyme required for sulfatase activity
MNKSLKIFLASSAELEDDRKKFEIYISRKNKTLHNRGVFIELVMWEDFIDAMSQTRLQDEYNKAVQECDIFVMLFATKVGQFTREEFETAFGQFQKSNRPWIYTYFKKVNVDLDEIPTEDFMNLRDFQDRLKNLGHFLTKYENIDGLTNHFYEQLEKLKLFQPLHHVEPQVSEKQIIQDYCQKIQQQFSTINLFGEKNTESKESQNVFDRMSNIDCGFVPLHLQDWRDEKDRGKRFPLKISDLFFSDNIQKKHFLLRGLPGSGKTTLLRYLTYHFACDGANSKKEYIPVYIRCKKLNEKVNKNISLEELVKEHIIENCDDDICYATLTGEKYFLKSPMILLFDGLDEIEDKQVSENISLNLVTLKKRYPHCKIIVSSRPIKLQRKDFSSFRHLDVLPLEPEMIEDYLNRWFEGNTNKINALIHTFKDRQRIKALAGNPFLLSMICFTYDKGGDSALIQKRSDLYDNCTKYLLQRRYDPTNISNSEEDYRKALKILKDLSLRFFLWQESDFPVDHVNVIGKRILTAEEIGKTSDFLDDVERKTGLLQRAKQGFTFVHRSLWEYFTALALKDTKPLNFIIKHAADPDWEEVVRLYAGFLPEKERIESLVRGLWNINRPLALRVTTEINISVNDLIKPLIEKEEGNQSKLLLIDSLEQSLPLIPQEEQKSLLEETLNILLTECEEKDCQVIYYAEQLLEKKQMRPLEREGLIYRLFNLGDASKRQQELLKDSASCFEWIEIEGGIFLMGDDEHREDEKPAHEVKVSSFSITKHPVTNYLLKSFLFGEKYPDYGGDRHPAIGNTWWEAYYFALWINVRLPTEAEWEYAARGGQHSGSGQGQYYFGDSEEELKDHAWFGESGRNYAHAVDEINPNSGKENLNPLGLANMLGNVWEWCSDWYDERYYEECKNQGIVENPVGPENGSYRVLRGGSWYNFAQYCRCADRNSYTPALRRNDVGFRLVFVP